jgi:hypothetical protein
MARMARRFHQAGMDKIRPGSKNEQPHIIQSGAFMHKHPLRLLVLAVVSVASPGAQAAQLLPTAYDTPNGDGQAHGGSFNHWDKAYTGTGSITLHADNANGQGGVYAPGGLSVNGHTYSFADPVGSPPNIFTIHRRLPASWVLVSEVSMAATPVPEPTAWVLMGRGLLTLLARGRIRS